MSNKKAPGYWFPRWVELFWWGGLLSLVIYYLVGAFHYLTYLQDITEAFMTYIVWTPMFIVIGANIIKKERRGRNG